MKLLLLHRYRTSRPSSVLQLLYDALEILLFDAMFCPAPDPSNSKVALGRDSREVGLNSVHRGIINERWLLRGRDQVLVERHLAFM